MAARIKVARELGDLKENADYHIAKEDQAHLETKIKRLRERLRNAVVVEVDDGADSFAFGRTAEVLDEATGKVNTWTLVGSTEADLAEGRLSAESPIGRALRDAQGRRAGRDRTPGRADLRRAEARGKARSRGHHRTIKLTYALMAHREEHRLHSSPRTATTRRCRRQPALRSGPFATTTARA